MAPTIVRIRVATPASVANLGAGFDCLALALNLENEFALYVDLSGLADNLEKEFEIDLSGRYKDTDPKMRTLDGNLFVRSFQRTRKFLWHRLGGVGRDVPKCPMMVYEEVKVPPIRGLGSSSSACVAGVLGAIEFMDLMSFPDHPFQDVRDDQDLCASLAMTTDSCPDNICASLAGGLTYSLVAERNDRIDDGHAHLQFFRQEIDDPDLRVVALVPNRPLDTTKARLELDRYQYSHVEAAFNICRSTCIPEVFRSRRYALLAEVLKDAIHQKQRAKVFYTDDRNKGMNLQHIFDQVIATGAYGACIGGAGSTLIAFAHVSKVASVKLAFRKAFEAEAKENWEIEDVMELKPNNKGADVTITRSIDRDTEGLPDSVHAWLNRMSEREASKALRRQPDAVRPGQAVAESGPNSEDGPRHPWLPEFRKRRI